MAETDIDVAITLDDDINITLDVNGGVSTGGIVDSASVDAAGATMNADTSLAGNGYFLNEPDLISNSATKVPSQQSVKAYVDTELKPVTPYGEGIQTRYPQLDDFYAKMENRITTPVDIMVVGDSVGVYGISGSWPLKLDQLLSDDDAEKRYDLAARPRGWVPAKYNGTSLGTHVATDFAMTSNEGTLTTNGFGAWTSTLTNGQKATQTGTMDAISIMYRSFSTGGQIEVRDGVGGTLLTTIETAGSAGYGQIWTSADLGSASRTIELTAVCGGGETVELEGVYVYSGNKDRGARVWSASRNGYSSADVLSNTNFFLAQIATINPDVILLCTGANDTTANYVSRMSALIDAVQAASPNTPIVLWSPLFMGYADKYIDANYQLAVQVAETYNLPFMSTNGVYGDFFRYDHQQDFIHITSNEGTNLIARHMYAVLTGRPLDILFREVGRKAPIASPTFTGTATAPTFSTTGGYIYHGNILSYPITTYQDPADSYQFMVVTGDLIANAIYGTAYPGLFLGGGAAAIDTGLVRTGVNALSILFGSTYGELTTLRMRSNAGTPESSVTAPVGALCRDTTNGVLYVKATGTGNTGWLAVPAAATISETNTGTSTTKGVTPDGLAGSNFGIKEISIPVVAAGTALTTGDGKAYFRVPSSLNGMNLVNASAAVTTTSSSGTPTVQIARGRQASATTAHAYVDMLSTLITIDATEYDSKDATTAAVINASNDDVATGDLIRVDVDVAGTGTAGLYVTLNFQLP